MSKPQDAYERAEPSGLRPVAWLTAAWAVLAAALGLHKNILFFHDDAFITLRYARHLMSGHGPVWNLSGAPVEGFSSPLHLLLVAALGLLHIPLPVVARLIAFGMHALLVVFLWQTVRRSSGLLAGALAAGLVLCSFPLLVWDLGGLDAVPFGALVAMGALLTLRYLETSARRDILLGGFVLGLAVFTRPDGAVVAFAALASCLLLGEVAFATRLKDVLLSGVVVTAVMLPWEIFRIAYFHAPLPNTYYAKVFGVPLSWRAVSGMHYWRSYLGMPPYLPILLTLIAVLLLVNRKLTRFDAGLYACIALYGLYVVDCGGDHMFTFRFFTPLVPLLAVALARGLAQLGALSQPGLAVVVSVALGFLSALQLTRWKLNPVVREPAGLLGEQVGRYVNTHWPAGSLVGLNVAGGTPYYADDLNYIDMLGLNDAVIARRNPVPLDGPWVHLIGHLKGDGASVLSRRPSYLILGFANGSTANGRVFVGDYEIMHAPEFASLYKQCVVQLPVDDLTAAQLRAVEEPVPVTFTYYQRRDLPQECSAP